MLDYIWIRFFLGVMMIVNPHLLWKTDYICTVKNGEPADLYLAIVTVGRPFLAITALVGGLIEIVEILLRQTADDIVCRKARKALIKSVFASHVTLRCALG